MHSDEFLPILLVLGSIIPLAAGPFLAHLADRAEAARSVVDAFAAVSLGGIVILHIWPHAFLTAGAWTLVGGLLGLLLPFLLHGSLHSHERKIYPGFVVLAFLGLAVHATLDGVALFSPLADEVTATAEAAITVGQDGHHAHDQGSAMLLALAVILHRLPMGLAVWWFAVPILGRRFATALLLAIAAATVLGFSVAGQLLVDLSMPGIAVFEATIAGMLLHVVMGHEHGHADHAHDEQASASEEAEGVSVSEPTRDHLTTDHDAHAEPTRHDDSHGHRAHDHVGTSGHGTVPWASAIGTLAGAALVGGLFEIHPMEQRLQEALSFRDTFVGLAFALAPWLLLGVVLDVLGRWLAGLDWRAKMGERLAREGGLRQLGRYWRDLGPAGRSELAWPAFLASWGLMGGAWTLWRWAGIAVVLFLGGFLQRWAMAGSSEPTTGPQLPETPPGIWQRLQRQAHVVFIWTLLGLGLVALLEPMVQWRVDAMAPVFGSVVAVLLAMTFYRNALHGTILAVLLLHWEWPATTVMAFLLVGSLWAVLGRLYEIRAGQARFWLLGGLFSGGAILALLVTLPEPVLWGNAGGGWPGLRQLATQEPCWIARGSAIMLLLLAVWVLFQKGFRGLLHPVFDPAEAIEVGGRAHHS